MKNILVYRNLHERNFFGDLLKLPTGIVRTIMKKTFQIDFVLSQCAQCLKICFGKTYVTITKHFLKKNKIY